MTLIGLLVLGYVVMRHHHQATVHPLAAPTVTVSRGTVTHVVSCSGKVTAKREVEIKCKATGQIINMPVDNGDAVKKNDLLLELDPELESRHVLQTQIDLDSAQARLEQAKAELDIAILNSSAEEHRAHLALASAQARAEDAEQKAKRMATLLERKLVSQEDAQEADVSRIQAENDLGDAQSHIDELPTLKRTVDLRNQDVVLANAAVETQRLALLDAKQRLKDTRVIAPIDGIVVNPKVQAGQIISGVGDVTGGTEVMSLADFSQVFVLGTVDESQIGDVAVNQPVKVEFDAYPSVAFDGLVRRVAPEGQTQNGNVVTFDVKVEVTSANRTLLKPEMTATMDIQTAQAKDALVVPIEAILHKQDEEFLQVRKADGSTMEHRVHLGLNDGQMQQILDGVQDHDVVLLQDDSGQSKWKSSGD